MQNLHELEILFLIWMGPWYSRIQSLATLPLRASKGIET